MVEDINALDLLQEEMKTDEIHLKVNAIHRMKTVILSIGTDDTNKKLIEYLEGKCTHCVISCRPHQERGRRSPVRHR